MNSNAAILFTEVNATSIYVISFFSNPDRPGFGSVTSRIADWPSEYPCQTPRVRRNCRTPQSPDDAVGSTPPEHNQSRSHKTAVWRIGMSRQFLRPLMMISTILKMKQMNILDTILLEDAATLENLLYQQQDFST